MGNLQTTFNISNRLWRGQEFNSDNGWGFGGATGIHYSAGDSFVRIGTAYFRHLPPARFARGVAVVNGVRHPFDISTKDRAAVARVAALLREVTEALS